MVSSIDKLSSAQWWSERSSSVRLTRTIAEYTQHLKLVLRCANSLMFIDPYIDPTKARYKDFIKLIQLAGNRSPVPLIEVHRVSNITVGRNILTPTQNKWQSLFSNAWSRSLVAAGLSVEILIWDDFHDRYLISDLLGICLPYGFDTSSTPDDITTWTRLGRKERDDIQREFDPAANRHRLIHSFKIS